VTTQTQTADPRADELLAVRCQLGERAAFDMLIERWHEPLWRYLRQFAHSDDLARDLAQDTWVRVLRGIATLREPAKLRPWLFGIARRVAMDRLRAAYAQPQAGDENLDDLAATDAAAEFEEDFANVEASLAALPAREREALTLFYLRELSLAEIAELTGAPPGTIKSRLFRARRLLRQELESKGAIS
jgi:RNA polymerase sigma-70 factor (ECF subfamily)